MRNLIPGVWGCKEVVHMWGCMWGWSKLVVDMARLIQ